jgi:hypothetical protein
MQRAFDVERLWVVALCEVCVMRVQRGTGTQCMACLRASCLIDKQKRCWWYGLLQREGGTTRKPDSNRQRRIEGSGVSEVLKDLGLLENASSCWVGKDAHVMMLG